MNDPAEDLYAPLEGVVIDADDPFLSGDVQMRVTQGAARERVKAEPGKPGFTSEQQAAGNEASAKKRSVVNRYNVGVRARELGVDPTEILCLLLKNTPEARARLNLPASAKTSPALMAKIAMDLLSYMAPKLKSVEVKDPGDKGKDSQGVTLFMPVNGREEKGGGGQVLELSVEDLAATAQSMLDEDDD